MVQFSFGRLHSPVNPLLVERVQENPTDPAFLFGSRGTAGVGRPPTGGRPKLNPVRADISVTLAAKSGALVLAPGDGDSFLSRILPAEGLRAEFDLGLAWSSDKGLTLRGSAGLARLCPSGCRLPVLPFNRPFELAAA